MKRYNRYLMNLIRMGKAKPSWIVSHELPLDQAPDAYEHFDARDEGWTKVVLRPELTAARIHRAANGRGIVEAIGRMRAAQTGRQPATGGK